MKETETDKMTETVTETLIEMVTKTKMVTTNNNQLLILFFELQLNYMYDPTQIKNNIIHCN